MQIQALFKKNRNETDFTFYVIHPTEEYRIQQEKMGILNGWGSVFNRFEEFLKKNKLLTLNRKIMKTMTCKELGGACDMAFLANTFEEIAEMSKKHGMEMYQAGDKAHLKAMGEMQELMKSPDAMKNWFNAKRNAFENLPKD